MNEASLISKNSSWNEALNSKAKILYNQIASLQNWAEKSDANDELLESLTAPYHEMLKKIYSEELPLARALDFFRFIASS